MLLKSATFFYHRVHAGHGVKNSVSADPIVPICAD
jgi:hypothetical protein